MGFEVWQFCAIYSFEMVFFMLSRAFDPIGRHLLSLSGRLVFVDRLKGVLVDYREMPVPHFIQPVIGGPPICIDDAP